MKIDQDYSFQTSVIKSAIFVGLFLFFSSCASSLQQDQRHTLRVDVKDLEFSTPQQSGSKEVNKDLKKEIEVLNEEDLKAKRYVSKKIKRFGDQELLPADYISIFGRVAIEEMYKYGIPASITLAQGILESGVGNGRLAREGNNHFGIKCHGWRGKKIYHDDDKEGECFRKYRNPYNSYRDHSLFLRKRSRYGSLFELDSRDYEGWAKGLKEAGYATAPDYAEKLVELIRRYKLYKFDNIRKGKWKNKSKKSKREALQQVYDSSTTTLTQALGQMNAEPSVPQPPLQPSVESFQEVPSPSQKSSEEKLKQAPSKGETHIVRTKETLYSISKKYETTVEELKNINNLKSNNIKIGQELTIKKE